MNIPEYLVYMSKRKCDYKTLMNVITAACPHEQLDVQFFSVRSVPSIEYVVKAKDSACKNSFF